MNYHIGCRVVRGPKWTIPDKESDGGEGVVGTVVGGEGGPSSVTTEKISVQVQWDSGIRREHRAGNLLIFDSAPTGTSHPEVKCYSCHQLPLAGIRWHCIDCGPKCDLCSTCYHQDRHKTDHSFERIDRSNEKGILVGKRSDANKIMSRGIFPGAKVMRGPDWKYKNQDGGKGKEGVVKKIGKWKEISRSGVVVSWDDTGEGKYRLGKEGKVDLRCTTYAAGGFYYREHLPILEVDYDKEKKCEQAGSAVCDEGENVSVTSRKHVDKSRREVTQVKAKTSAKKGGRSPLHRAAIEGQTKLAKVLLDNGENVNIRDQFQLTPLHLSCFYGQDAMVKLLLEHGADVDAVDRFQKTPLQKAEQVRHEEIVHILLENGARRLFNPISLQFLCTKAVVFHEKNSGFNLLQAFSYACDYDKVLRILGHVIDITKELRLESTLNDARVSPGTSAYEIVSSCQSKEKKRLNDLFDKLEEVCVSLSDLHKCAQACDVETVVELVLEDGHPVDTLAVENRTPLLWTSVSSNCETIQALVDLGANVNVFSSSKVTPLTQAADWNNYMAVAMLLENSVHVNGAAIEGDTALHRCARRGHCIIAHLLLQNGSDVNVKNEKNVSALNISVNAGDEKFTELLLGNGADPNTTTVESLEDRLYIFHEEESGEPQWHYILVDKSKLSLFLKISRVRALNFFGIVIDSGKGSNPPEEVKEYMAKQFSSSSAEIPNKTVLHQASERNDVRIIELLVNYGANVNARDADGYTPLHLAVCNGKLEGARRLVELSADVSLLTNDGLNAFQLAKINEEMGIQEILKQ